MTPNFEQIYFEYFNIGNSDTYENKTEKPKMLLLAFKYFIKKRNTYLFVTDYPIPAEKIIKL